MTVRGFTIDPNDRNKRIPTTYTSKEERAWCECIELTDAGFYEEASAKFRDYWKHCSHYKCDSRDTLLLSRINMGIALSGKEDADEAFDMAIEQVAQAAIQDSGCFHDEIQKVMEQVIQARTNQLVPMENNETLSPTYNDFTKASTKNLVKMADMYLKLYESVYEMQYYLTDVFDDSFICIFEVLADRKKKQTVRSIAEKILDLEVVFDESSLECWNGYLD